MRNAAASAELLNNWHVRGKNVSGGGELGSSGRCLALSTIEEIFADLVILIEGSKFGFKSRVYLRCIQFHQRIVDMTFGLATHHRGTQLPKRYGTFEVYEV